MTEKVSRRRYIKYAGAGVVVVAVAGAGAYYATRPGPTPAPTPTTLTPAPTPTTLTPAPTPTTLTPAPTPTAKGEYPWRPEKPVTIKVGLCAGPIAHGPLKLVPEFNKEFPNINVEIIEVPWTRMLEIFLLDFKAHTASYDMVNVYTTHTPPMAASGGLLPLNSFMEDPTLYDEKTFNFNDIDKSMIEACSYKGKLYALPVNTNIQSLFYRGDLVESAGLEVPETVDELEELAKKLTGITDPVTGTKHMYGYTYQGGKGAPGAIGWVFHSMLWTWGGRHFDESFRPMFNDKPGVEALTWLVNMAQYAPPSLPEDRTMETTSQLITGLVASAINYADHIIEMDNPEKSKVIGKFQFTPFPRVPGQSSSHMIAGTHAIGINADTKNPKACWTFLRWLMEPKNVRLGAKLGIIPVRHSVLEDPNVETPIKRGFPAISKAIAGGIVPPQIPEWSEIEEGILGVHCSKALLKEETPKEALDKAADETYKLLKDAGYYK
jgi:ABC-type glycerol-3-phosphate transport system substrate-binding protein